jgi:tRNA G18 (ribose-2'-O)-methylase SpoU
VRSLKIPEQLCAAMQLADREVERRDNIGFLVGLEDIPSPHDQALTHGSHERLGIMIGCDGAVPDTHLIPCPGHCGSAGEILREDERVPTMNRVEKPGHAIGILGGGLVECVTVGLISHGHGRPPSLGSGTRFRTLAALRPVHCPAVMESLHLPDGPWIEVTDRDDPRIALYRDLKDASLRKRGGLFMAEGELVVRRAIAHASSIGQPMVSALVSPTRLRALATDLRTMAGSGASVYVAEQAILDGIAGFSVHRGCLALGKCPPDRSLDDVLPPPGPSLVVVCESLTNVDNLGVVFRAAAGFEADAVLLDPRCCDPLYRRALRVSIGHSLALPWVRLRRWPDDLLVLRDRGYTVAALELAPGAVPLHAYAWPDRLAVVIGAEGPGVRRRTLDIVDDVLEIPMHPSVDSLNVGAAAAIALYAARHRLRGS